MDENSFWRLIAETKGEAKGNCALQAALLQSRLELLPPKQIRSFDAVLKSVLARSYRWDMFGAAVLINDAASDDSFEDWRCWLIMQGREAFENALTAPDSLADVVTALDVDGEDILYVATTAYENETGKEMLAHPALEAALEPQGERWEDEELEARLPRLAARVAKLREGAGDD